MKHFMLLGLLWTTVNSYAQPDTKLWLSQQVKFQLEQNVYFNLSFFQNYEQQQITYRQFTGTVTHRLGKRLDMNIGFGRTYTLRNKKLQHRLRLGFIQSLNKSGLNHSIRLEYFYPTTAKYQLRAAYTLARSYRFKWKQQRLKYYGSFTLFQFWGGKIRSIYDSEGERITRSSPNGIHRARLSTGISMMTYKYLRCKIYSMWQQEFNLPFNQKGKLNTFNRRQDRIRNSFSNYLVFGVGIQFKPYQLKFKKRRRKRHLRNRTPTYFDDFTINYF